jgi:Polyketide cyclase / dehydrase and lipid transport
MTLPVLAAAALLLAPALPAAAPPEPAPATAAAGAAAGPEAPPPIPPPPDAADAARLATGEVLLSSRPYGTRQLAEEIGRGLIDASPQRVFAAVADFAHYDEWVPFVKKSDAHPQADGSVLSFQSLDLPFPLGTRYYRFRARTAVEERAGSAAWRVWWSYVPGSGNVADHHGWWVLVPAPGGKTLGACLLFTDPGGSTPAWALHRGTAETMPYIFSALRQQIHRSRYDRQ